MTSLLDPYRTLKTDLEYSYMDVFTPEEIAEAVDSARELLEPRANVATFLPVLVARQAREQLMAKAQAEGRIAKKVPEILFVCVHNAGRSQMAAALTEHLSARRVHVRSAGSAPTGEINPVVIEALAERGITLTAAYPKPLTDTVAGRGRGHHHGLRRHLPVLPGQDLRGLGRPRPRGPADRRRPGHSRRPTAACHRAVAPGRDLTIDRPPEGDRSDACHGTHPGGLLRGVSASAAP